MLPGRVEQRGSAWAVVYPAEEGPDDIVELTFDDEAGARQTLRIFHLRFCLRTPGFESDVDSLVAEVQAFAREAGEEDVEDWCNKSNLHEIRDASLADLVAMLSGEDPDGEPDGGGAAAAADARSTGSAAPAAPAASRAAAQEQASAVATEEEVPAEAVGPGRQADSRVPMSAAAASEEQPSGSDYLGVSRVDGAWQARISLQLDAQGRPSPQAETCQQAVAAGSELEAALARDVAVLWHERWCFAMGGPGNTDPCRVFNFGARRYGHDASLACMLSELPSWPELGAYLEQVQAGGFLAAAAAAYDADQLPARPWPDPDGPPPAAHGGNEGHREGPGLLAGGSRKRRRPEDGADGGGGGGTPGGKRRVGWRQHGEREQQGKRPAPAWAAADSDDEPSPGRERQPGARQPSSALDAGVYRIAGKSGGVHRVWVKVPRELNPSTDPRAFLLNHADHGIASAAAEVAAFWRATVLQLPGARGRLHDRLLADSHLVQRLAGVLDVVALRAVLRELVEEGWMGRIAGLLPPPPAAAAQPGEAAAAAAALPRAAVTPADTSSRQQQGAASQFRGVSFHSNRWIAVISITENDGPSKHVVVLRHRDPAVAAAARDVAAFWKMRIVGQASHRQIPPALEDRYSQDRGLQERLRAVRDVPALRQLLQGMLDAGELDELAAQLQRRCASPAHGSRAERPRQAEESDESGYSDEDLAQAAEQQQQPDELLTGWQKQRRQSNGGHPAGQQSPAAAQSGEAAAAAAALPGAAGTSAGISSRQEPQQQGAASQFRGVSFHNGKWSAVISMKKGDASRGKNWVVLRHRDPTVAAAARDVAAYWKTRIVRQTGHRQVPPLLEDRYSQDRGLQERLRAVRDQQALRQLLQRMLGAGELEDLAVQLRQHSSSPAAARGSEAQRVRHDWHAEESEWSGDSDEDMAQEAEQQQQPEGLLAGWEKQRRQSGGGHPAGQQPPAAAQPGEAAAAAAVSPRAAGAWADASDRQEPHKQRAHPQFPGLKLNGGKWDACISMAGTARKHWVVLRHQDPAVAAAARDVAVFWKMHIVGQANPRQAPPILKARYSQDRGLQERLQAVPDVPALRQLLQGMLDAGELDEVVAQLRRRSSSPAHGSGAERPRHAEESDESGYSDEDLAQAAEQQQQPDELLTGWQKQRRQSNGGHPAGQQSPAAAQPGEAAAAAAALPGAAGTSAGISSRQEPQQQRAASHFPGVTSRRNKWSAIISMTGDDGVSKIWTVLSHKDPAVAAAARDVAAYWKTRIVRQTGHRQVPPLLEDRYSQDRGLQERLQAVPDVPALRQVVQGMLDAGELEDLAVQLRQHSSSPAAARGSEAQRARRDWHGEAGDSAGHSDEDGAHESPSAAQPQSPAQRLPPSGFVGVELRNGRWQAWVQLKLGEGASTRVTVFSHADPALAAAARDLAVFYKTRVRGERGPRQVPAQLAARYEQDAELMGQLRNAHGVEDLRQLLQRRLDAGLLDGPADELQRLSAAAEAEAAAAAAPPPHGAQQEGSGAGVAMAAPPAGWQQSLAAWQGQAAARAEAWAAQLPAAELGWLQGEGLAAMLAADAPRAQQQQQQGAPRPGGGAASTPPREQPAQRAGGTAEPAAGADPEPGQFPGAAGLRAAAAAPPQEQPPALRELEALLAGLEVEPGPPPPPEWGVSAGDADALGVGGAGLPQAADAWPQPPQRRPAAAALAAGDVVLHCSNCRGVGGLPLLERLLLVGVRRGGAASTPQRAGHRCECLVLARGAAVGQLVVQAPPRPAILELARVGRKWRAVAVPLRTRSWFVEGRVPLLQLEAVLGALAALEQQAPGGANSPLPSSHSYIDLT